MHNSSLNQNDLIMLLRMVFVFS